MKKIRKLIENFQHISDYMGRRQIATIAASTAFWFFLSIVPIVILCVSVLPYTSITEEQLLTTVAPVLPDSMNQLIRVIIADVYSSGVGVEHFHRGDGVVVGDGLCLAHSRAGGYL